MFTRSLVALATATVLVASGVASASTLIDGAPGPGYFAENVEFVTHVPLNNDSAGAALVGKYFYVNSSRGLIIYDVTNPESPAISGVLPLPQMPYFAEEDPSTNGKILVMGTADGLLNIVSVEDKTNPQIIGTLDGGSSHTSSCVLDCKWVYNSDGRIIDITDPTKPEEAGNWMDGTPVRSGHDVTEVAPGIVMTSSTPMLLLDARKSPAKPKVIATLTGTDPRYIHANMWPRSMKDRFLLVQAESTTTLNTSSCSAEDDGSFMTFDATKWKKTKTFKMIDELRYETGLPTDGRMPYGTYCAHWFDVHPSYNNGGVLAMAFYENGTHILKVDPKGKITETGYFVPLAGSVSADYWINDEIIYAVDYNRGIDILRYTGDL
jgi:LVIVD repeat